MNQSPRYPDYCSQVIGYLVRTRHKKFTSVIDFLYFNNLALTRSTSHEVIRLMQRTGEVEIYFHPSRYPPYTHIRLVR